MNRGRVEITLNGERVSTEVDACRTLADTLRDDLDAVATKVGCEHGVCGACTVLLDGHAVRSCLLFTIQLDGAEITTLEGLAGPELSPLQEAFRRNHALQCGFCTSGFIMSLTEWLQDPPPNVDDRQIRRDLGGNICRCTGYQGIVAAVKEMVGAEPGSPADA